MEEGTNRITKNYERYTELLLSPNGYADKVEGALKDIDRVVTFGKSSGDLLQDLSRHNKGGELVAHALSIETRNEAGARDYVSSAKTFSDSVPKGKRILILEDFVRGGHKIQTLWNLLKDNYDIQFIVIAIDRKVFNNLPDELKSHITYISDNKKDVEKVDLRDL